MLIRPYYTFLAIFIEMRLREGRFKDNLVMKESFIVSGDWLYHRSEETNPGRLGGKPKHYRCATKKLKIKNSKLVQALYWFLEMA